MGKVATFTLEGIDCWFNSMEHHPPHFHARRKGQWHVRVYFQQAKPRMIERVRGPSGRLKPADRDALRDMAKWYREELLSEWEQKANCDD